MKIYGGLAESEAGVVRNYRALERFTKIAGGIGEEEEVEENNSACEEVEEKNSACEEVEEKNSAAEGVDSAMIEEVRSPQPLLPRPMALNTHNMAATTALLARLSQVSNFDYNHYC